MTGRTAVHIQNGLVLLARGQLPPFTESQPVSLTPWTSRAQQSGPRAHGAVLLWTQPSSPAAWDTGRLTQLSGSQQQVQWQRSPAGAIPVGFTHTTQDVTRIQHDATKMR